MDKDSVELSSLEDRLAEREQTLLEQQQRLDEQQQRLDETFRDLVEVTRQLQPLQRSKEGLQEQLQEKSQALSDAEARVGTLVRQLEERERAMLDAEKQHSQAAQMVEQRYTREQQALEGVVQRQSQDLGRLVGLLERQQAERENEIELASRKKGVGHLLWLPFAKLSGVMFKGRKQRQRVAQEAAMIESSPWFDRQWYLSTYPDVAADEKMSQAPARHYLLIGGLEGRNPGPDFDSAFYIDRYDDVRESGINPLLHFIKFGEHEQRQPKAVN